MKHAMDASRKQVLSHETAGLFTDYPTFWEKLEDFADRLDDMGENADEAVEKWLQCGK